MKCFLGQNPYINNFFPPFITQVCSFPILCQTTYVPRKPFEEMRYVPKLFFYLQQKNGEGGYKRRVLLNKNLNPKLEAEQLKEVTLITITEQHLQFDIS